MRLQVSRSTIACLCLIACTLVASTTPAADVRVENADVLKRAATAAQPGDRVLFARGEWRDVNLVIEAQGTEAAPIVFAAERPGETVINGKSRLRIGGEHLIVSGLLFRSAYHPNAVLEFRRDSKRPSSHCRVTDCAFVDCNPFRESQEESAYVSLYGHENRLDHCELSGKTSRGTTLIVWLNDESSCRHRIDSNYFGPRPPLKRNGGETIRIGDSKTSLVSAGCVVESNLFERCSGEAEIVSNKSCENIYRHNTFRGCGGALTLRHGHNCRVERNWFFGDGEKGTGGVRIIGAGHRVVNNYFEGLRGDDGRATLCLMTGLEDSPLNGYSPVKDAVVAFTTIIDCKQPLVMGYADEDVDATVPPADCVVANNLILGRGGLVVFPHREAVGLRAERNLVWNGESEPGFGLERLAEAPDITPSDAGWQQAGPALPRSDDGSSAPRKPTIDIEGQPRPASPQVGCDEFSREKPRFRPLVRGDVGPSWQRTNR